MIVDQVEVVMLTLTVEAIVDLLVTWDPIYKAKYHIIVIFNLTVNIGSKYSRF